MLLCSVVVYNFACRAQVSVSNPTHAEDDLFQDGTDKRLITNETLRLFYHI